MVCSDVGLEGAGRFVPLSCLAETDHERADEGDTGRRRRRRRLHGWGRHYGPWLTAADIRARRFAAGCLAATGTLIAVASVRRSLRRRRRLWRWCAVGFGFVIAIAAAGGRHEEGCQTHAEARHQPSSTYESRSVQEPSQGSHPFFTSRRLIAQVARRTPAGALLGGPLMLSIRKTAGQIRVPKDPMAD